MVQVANLATVSSTAFKNYQSKHTLSYYASQKQCLVGTWICTQYYYYIVYTCFERSYIYDTVSIPKAFHETKVCSSLSLSLSFEGHQNSPKQIWVPSYPANMECLKHWGPYPLPIHHFHAAIAGLSVYGQGSTCCRVKPARLSNKAPSLDIEIGDWDPTVATSLLLCFYMLLVFAKKRLEVHQSDNLPLAKGWGGSTGVLVTWSWTTYLSSVSMCLPKCQVGS